MTPDTAALLAIFAGGWVWWSMTRAAWKEANSYMGNPVKAFIVMIIYAPIAGSLVAIFLATILG